MIIFTSDFHLGHANAIEYESRPFSDVEEMNKRLIQNINDTVVMSLVRFAEQSTMEYFP